MLVGQGRPARGHRPGQAGAREGDDVGVALAHDDLAGAHDVGLGPVEAVEHAALRVDGRLRRVLVLRAVAAGHRPSAERDGIAVGAKIGNMTRSRNASCMAVATVEEPEPGVAQHVVGEPERAGERVPVVGRPAELVGADDVAVVAARAEVGRAPRAASGASSSRSWYHSTAAVMASTRPRPALPLARGGRVVVAELDAGSPASRSTASAKSRCSTSRTKVMTSPFAWHPKQ